MSNIVIDSEFKALIPPLSTDERGQLKDNLLEWGCLDPLRIWAEQGILLDGHNRFEICEELEIPYQIEPIELNDRSDAINWILENQLGRRNLSAENIALLRGLQYERSKIKKRGGGDRRSQSTATQRSKSCNFDSGRTAKILAVQHGVSPGTILNDARFYRSVEQLEEVSPGFRDEVLSSRLNLSRKDVIRIAEDVKRWPEIGTQILQKARLREVETKGKPKKKIRMANDYYPTPDPLITALLDQLTIEGTILEPCAGHGAIAAHFPGCLTNEPYPTRDFQPNFTVDAMDPAFWSKMQRQGIDWVVTNPPYGELVTPIVKLALATARVDVAMLLRMNWLEPCRDRAQLLQQYADHMTHVIAVSPRPKFRADTNSSDNITVAWVVWQKQWSWQQQGIDCPFQFLANWRCASDPLTVPDRTARLHERMR